MILCVIKTDSFVRLSKRDMQNGHRTRVTMEIFDQRSGWQTIETAATNGTYYELARKFVDHLERVYEQKIQEVVPYEEMGPASNESIRKILGLDEVVPIDRTEIEHPNEVEE